MPISRGIIIAHDSPDKFIPNRPRVACKTTTEWSQNTKQDQKETSGEGPDSATYNPPEIIK